MQYIDALIVAIALLPGIVFVFLPGVPALGYMFLVTIIFGFIDKFQKLSWLEITILSVLTVLSLIVDWLSGVVGARWSGASFAGLAAGMIGMILGSIVFSPLGGILGLFACTLLAEYYIGKTHREAFTAATGSMFGTIAGMFINAVLAIVFIILASLFIII